MNTTPDISPLDHTLTSYIDASDQRRSIIEHDYRSFYRDGNDPLQHVPTPHRVIESESSEGTVQKFLLTIPAGPVRPDSRALPVLGGTALDTESVIIPMATRAGTTTYTLCVSSQIGCAMGCDFCETAQMGLVRSLTPGEIVAQWWAATHHLGQTIKNIVFMGMGEPLDNLPAVLRAIEILTDHSGPSIAMSNITVSTVGRVKEMRLLRERVTHHGWKRLNLAVSINAPNDDIRNALMPVNRAAPLAELIEVLESWPLRSSSGICAEYVLIPGVNDADEHADEIADRLKNVRCCLNVIPYNPVAGLPYQTPSYERQVQFRKILEAGGIRVRFRHRKGDRIDAACGQLRRSQMEPPVVELS